MTITAGSLFSGIGGMDLGLERAGMEIVWQVENDAYCQKILEKHWPGVVRYGDVRGFPDTSPANAVCESGACGSEKQVRGQEGRAAPRCYCEFRCDLICGGFPCQPVSLAGRRKAARDPRWLWPHFARIVRLLRPRYVLVENVPGLLVHGYGMGSVLGELSALGFDAEWATLPASAFGAPHKRERVFVVAYAQRGEGGERYEPNQKRRWKKATEQAGVASPSTPDRDRDRAQARIFRPGREIESMPRPCWGTDQPGVDRTLARVPHRVDRIRGLGNAVVPQVAEWIGRQIIAFDEERAHDH